MAYGIGYQGTPYNRGIGATPMPTAIGGTAGPDSGLGGMPNAGYLTPESARIRQEARLAANRAHPPVQTPGIPGAQQYNYTGGQGNVGFGGPAAYAAAMQRGGGQLPAGWQTNYNPNAASPYRMPSSGAPSAAPPQQRPPGQPGMPYGNDMFAQQGGVAPAGSFGAGQYGGRNLAFGMGGGGYGVPYGGQTSYGPLLQQMMGRLMQSGYGQGPAMQAGWGGYNPLTMGGMYGSPFMQQPPAYSLYGLY